MDERQKRAILDAVDARFGAQVDFLADLTRFPSTRGREQGAQDFMADQLAERGLSVDRWTIDVNDIRHLPGFSPVIGNYEDAVNVVATHRAATGRCPLTGHNPRRTSGGHGPER